MMLIRAQNISKTFGNIEAVKNLNLTVSAGEIYGLVGPDGAGKTTTMRLLCGAYPPSFGDTPPLIEVAGYDVLGQVEQARECIGYLPQRFSLYEELTVLENIRFFAEVRGLSAREWYPRSMQILEFVGLHTFAHRRAGNLSGGMKQKLGLAVALVHRPQVLLLDEPTTGVDPVTRQDFWQLIIRLASEVDNGQGTAVLVSTPYMDEASRCTRLGFMRQGLMVAEGSPAELCRPLEGRILELGGQPLQIIRRVALQQQLIEDVHMFGDRLHIKLKPGVHAGSVKRRLRKVVASQGGRIDKLEEVKPGIEDVFMSLLEVED